MLHGVRMLLRTLLVSSKSSRRGGQQVTSLSSLQPRLKWAADIAGLDGRTVPARRRTTVNATLPTPPFYASVGLTASPYSLQSDTPERAPYASAGTETESARSKWRNRHRRSLRRAGCWRHGSPSHLQTHSSIPTRGLARRQSGGCSHQSSPHFGFLFRCCREDVQGRREIVLCARALRDAVGHARS